MPAPIALFAYCRPNHVARTIEALKLNPEARDTVLFVFSDAPRNPAAKDGVDAVREILRHVESFADVQVVYRDENYGLARNITTGVSAVLDRFSDVIVVEDDVLVSPHFLGFMNEALSCYRDEPRVGSVTGYCYPVEGPLPETFFIRGADCWGWATWRDRWELFRHDGRQLMNELQERHLEHAFDFDGTMNCIQMLREQIDNKNDSWAIRWHASCFLSDRLILYPGRSLVRNIGTDGSGTHFNVQDTSYDVDVSASPVRVGGIPVEESAVARAAFRDYFHRCHTGKKTRSRFGHLPVLGAVIRRLHHWLGSKAA